MTFSSFPCLKAFYRDCIFTLIFSLFRCVRWNFLLRISSFLDFFLLQLSWIFLILWVFYLFLHGICCNLNWRPIRKFSLKCGTKTYQMSLNSLISWIDSVLQIFTLLLKLWIKSTSSPKKVPPRFKFNYLFFQKAKLYKQIFKSISY